MRLTTKIKNYTINIMPPKKTPQKWSEGNTAPLTTPNDDEPEYTREFCFTHFDDHIHIPNIIHDSIRYLVMGRETCPKTKKQHFQCYVYFRDAKTISAAGKFFKKHWGKQPHMEPIKGTFLQNYDYCTKDKDFYQYGNPPQQGHRKDLDELKDNILSGETSVEKIILEQPHYYHQYGRTLDKIEDLKLRKCYRKTFTEGIWYYGKTGCGKSMKAFENFSPDTHYIYPYDNGWCDAYKQQETVILDDFRGQLPFNELLRMVDIHPNYYFRRRCREPMPFNSKKVIITSALHPKEIFYNLEQNDKLDQLYRRFKIIELKNARNQGILKLSQKE